MYVNTVKNKVRALAVNKVVLILLKVIPLSPTIKFVILLIIMFKAIKIRKLTTPLYFLSAKNVVLKVIEKKAKVMVLIQFMMMTVNTEIVSDISICS